MESTNAPLTSDEMLEEELRDELAVAGFKETDMDRNEMESLLEIIKQSKEISLHNQDSEVKTNMPIPSFSLKNMSVSSSSSDDDIISISKNKKPAKNQNYIVKSNFTENSIIDDRIKSKSSHFKDEDFPALGCKSNVLNKTNEPRLWVHENKNTSNKNLDSISTLNYEEDKTEISNKEESISLYNKKLTQAEFEKLSQQWYEKLGKLHEEKLKSKIRKKITHWGSPIKVATNCSDQPVRDTYDRATKRKALYTIASSICNDSNDDNSDNEFSNVKKRKCQQIKKPDKQEKIIQEVSKARDSPVEMIDVDDWKDNSNVEAHDYNDKHISEVITAEDKAVYPRRIEPPNPAKKNSKDTRVKKTNMTLKTQTRLTKKNSHLNEEELTNLLNDVNDDCIKVDEIKPLPVSSQLQKKLQLAELNLKEKHMAENRKIEMEEEVKKQKEKEELLQIDERISRRLQEQEDENNRKLEKEKKLNEQKDFYNSILNSHSHKVNKSNFNNSKQTEEEINEDMLLADDDDNDNNPIITHTNFTDKSKIKKLCPICQKSFPYDEIESHASECNAFLLETDEVIEDQPSSSRFSTSDYKCSICKTYKTPYKSKYEEHVVKCKERSEDKRYGLFT